MAWLVQDTVECRGDVEACHLRIPEKETRSIRQHEVRGRIKRKLWNNT